jgi:hypothetical protein
MAVTADEKSVADRPGACGTPDEARRDGVGGSTPVFYLSP